MDTLDHSELLTPWESGPVRLHVDTIAVAHEVLTQMVISPRDPEAVSKMKRLRSAICDLEAAAKIMEANGAAPKPDESEGQSD